MPFQPIDRLCDTIISWIEEQRPVYDSVIDLYYHKRRLNVILGRRNAIPASSLPSIEVHGASESTGWHACRVQHALPLVEMDITVDNRHPEMAVRLQAMLVTLTVRILVDPIHILPQINNTETTLYDSLPENVRYGTADGGTQRVATISWNGKYLNYLQNRNFPLDLQAYPEPLFPPL